MTTQPEGERVDGTARVMAQLLVDAGADPDALRRLTAQVWHDGWVAGWDDRAGGGSGVTRNPYDDQPPAP